jgi:4-alpha-glucanotransferase
VSLPRRSGILLHPTSLPGRFGIGDLGAEAHRFVDFLAGAGQRLWQVLPLGPAGVGDSPYQSFSAFAGNPLLIGLEALAEVGLLSRDDLADAPSFPDTEVDFGAVIPFKLSRLARAAERFHRDAPTSEQGRYRRFCAAEPWLEDFALFMALKDAHGGAAWNAWEAAVRQREPGALERARAELAGEIEAHRFAQFAFLSQWRALRAACAEKGIALMGDIPIFVAHNSADVWAHQELFRLDDEGAPEVVAGVPPDYFSPTGQCWGNPLYRWDALARTEYRWWAERFRAAQALVDLVRVDHFRGFEAYWEVPGSDRTAVRGHWVRGPGSALFQALEKELGPLPVIAENLGLITPEVEALRERFGFPGMAVLQFAFDDGAGNVFLPHNHRRELVAYTGTHDNETLVGWWRSLDSNDHDAAARGRRRRELALRYLGAEETGDIHWRFIRAVLSSVAETAVIPLQDVLGLGSEARMNFPGRPDGNWRWRYREGQLTSAVGERLRSLTELYGRTAP